MGVKISLAVFQVLKLMFQGNASIQILLNMEALCSVEKVVTIYSRICFRNADYHSRKKGTSGIMEFLDCIYSKRLAAVCPTPENWNRFSSRNVVFQRSIKYWAVDKVQKLNNSNFASHCQNPSESKKQPSQLQESR